ncbi:ribosome-inactivating family protein [Streptomyces sp. NRRL F-2664]|uniref:ribosome-inactivating family protein n=1 Tax=Streptomyces sp. NRRL F-2664 TaxID=1463842 RepID=UPI000B08894B|nr:ribosome-inactivating family protein [Streptomyces sp. NRRL F-2664]
MFSPAQASADDYRSLTSTIRAKAEDAQGFFGGDGRRDGDDMPHLPLHIQLRGLFIELFIELRPRNTSLRLSGFRKLVGNGEAPPEASVHHVRDAAAPQELDRTETLPFGGSRADLETAAAVRRAGILIGRRPLSLAVIRLHQNCDPRSTAYGMLVLSEMLCEAARYPALADAMSRLWVTGGRL